MRFLEAKQITEGCRGERPPFLRVFSIKTSPIKKAKSPHPKALLARPNGAARPVGPVLELDVEVARVPCVGRAAQARLHLLSGAEHHGLVEVEDRLLPVRGSRARARGEAVGFFSRSAKKKKKKNKKSECFFFFFFFLCFFLLLLPCSSSSSKRNKPKKKRLTRQTCGTRRT